ncbi:TGF beta receptor associated protein-like protein 1 [Sporormia fimetaria CBS 119925]|uniref:TGF beta receptor associated protein-like protein 1 n=1 Tax=Sporormia fimetaria CBS 119925 TaxID=1340428 RepID=A0A6A6V0C2_9PLEO|nr:TGF beta receptor associated protein-like protein 1 [Sporormia fimetaria CBS 119925]
MAQASQSAPRPPLDDGAYIIRKLATDLPLADDHITCIEVWNGNLYVGTSAAEILHFVLLPPEPDDDSGTPTAILASRLEPPHSGARDDGVQQILLLPKVSKALVLCNNTLSFYSLPELSLDSTTKPLTCSWVGGVDLNALDDDHQDGVVVMLGLKSKLRLIRISEDVRPQSLRTIEYGGCLNSVRRDTFSCAADPHSYALLDLDRQQKIGLFPISSLDEDAGEIGGAAENIASTHHASSRSVSSASVQPFTAGERGHVRSSSLGIFGGGGDDLQRTESPGPFSRSPARVRDSQHPERTSSLPRANSPAPEKPLPVPPSEASKKQESSSQNFVPLKPLIASPSPNEFLLAVGTTSTEPGVGMFVNLDGDVCRGSIQFSTYPEALVVDGKGVSLAASMGPEPDAEEGYVLAVVHRQTQNGQERGVEVQRWDVDAGEGEASKEWLNLHSLGEDQATAGLGMRTVVEDGDLTLPEIGHKLSVKRIRVPLSESSLSAENGKQPSRQDKADMEFTQRLSKCQTRHVLWGRNSVWWIVRNPMVIQFDSRLLEAQSTSTGDGVRIQPIRREIEMVLGNIRGLEPRSETEYLSLVYIRQKASVLLFIDLILRSSTNIIIFENEKRITEQALVEGEIDPRVILCLLPVLNSEVVQGPDGIQISGGIVTLIEQFLEQNNPSALPATVNGPFGDNLLHLVKRYLSFWKKRRGMASVTNDPYVFQSVDAALLHILLLLDQNTGSVGTSSPLRAELYELVDNEVECFSRAIELLEQFKRLYVLSRFYQRNSPASAKASKVLATWKRILEGETDEGGEFVDGETELRKYLTRIRDRALVEEYGTWLADRNPKLGVQVFADDKSRVKFSPTDAVALLKKKAPGAVKEYLEYLVFGKKHVEYVNELIVFYLDIVITALEGSRSAKDTLLQTYETYRALSAPKPSYRQFITDNKLDEEWWHSRLRLLQLLGSNLPATASYNVSSILTRLEPYEQELVPEMIILNGRQGRHEQAIRLLTHGLKDFDTAINYCLLGGSSIFRPPGYVPQNEIADQEEQARLFSFLLQECLRLDDISERILMTGELLQRFSGWFDVVKVLEMIPDEWSVDIVGEFLINALRRLVRERAETGIAKALNGSQNLQTSVELADKMVEVGPTVEKVI